MQVIELSRTMSTTTRIFSFGFGHSPSRSLVKGLARATRGQFVFIPPMNKVDAYVGSQLARALQPALVDARLQWHGLSSNVRQAPSVLPPLYVNDRVIIYGLVNGNGLHERNVSVDLFIGDNRMGTIKLPTNVQRKRDTLRRLAAKALIQELQHNRPTT
jgi:hypothetical protein